MPDNDYTRELLKREIEWLDRHTQTQIRNIEKATGVAMDTLNERLKGWPEKMDKIEQKVAEFRGQAMVFGGIAGAIISLIASVVASVIIFRVLN